MKQFAELFVLYVLALSLIGSMVMARGSTPKGEKSANRYVGMKICAPCHKTAKSGNQFGIWQKSKHAQAFTILKTPKADSIARAKGSTQPAAESPECLECHVTATDSKLMEKTFDKKDGNQCETCHGPGSAFKSMSIMKDKLKAIAAGLTGYKDDAAIEAKCKTCHNEKSPTFKGFKFNEMWGKIKHPVPKKG